MRSELAGASPTMAGLDLIDDSDRTGCARGPSARSLLPGAAMLADLWGDGG